MSINVEITLICMPQINNLERIYFIFLLGGSRYDTSGRSAVGIAVVAPFWPHSKCSF